MRRFIACLLICFSASLYAQSIIEVQPQQCVWRGGDEPVWAAPNLNETGWKPLASWKVAADQPWMWVRCHANLPALRQASHPALEVKTARAYELFLDGRLIGQNGNLSNGQASIDPDRTFPVAASDIAEGVDTVALRIMVRRIGGPPSIAAGEGDWLRDRHGSQALAGAVSYLPVVLGFGVIAVLGFALLALYLNDRGHRELLLLAIVGWCLALIRLCEFCNKAMVPVPAWAWEAVYGLGETAAVSEVWFSFRLAGRKVPMIYKLLAAATLWWAIDSWIFAFAPARISLEAALFNSKAAWAFLTAGGLAMTAPFAAFWPWRKVPRAMRAMAGCAMLWALMDISWFFVRAPILFAEGHDVPPQWWMVLLELRAFGTIAAIIALVALLFREHRRAAQERAVLVGEMQAAQQIQRILAPNELPCAPGLAINVAFQPMREVGGDFYLCRVLADGRQRILLGDVSGKGTAAAMTAALLLGGAEDHEEMAPGELLSHLNRVLRESQVGGFATCLCADFEGSGKVTFANAGHLPPYRAGEELPSVSALPLGIGGSEDGYEESSFELQPGDTLTFLSDGVVEARSSSGQLFGFDRAREISDQSAEEIARAAQDFGQEDDITVLTLTFAPAEVALA